MNCRSIIILALIPY